MKKIKNKLILAAMLGAGICFPAYSVPAADIPANIGGYGGAINSHDMMMLREKMRLEQEKEDLQNFQERKEKKDEHKEDVIEGNPDTGEKIYNKETSKIIQEKKLEQENLKKPKKKHFWNKKEKEIEQETETEESTDSTVEKDSTTTTIRAAAQKALARPDTVYIQAVGVTNSKIFTDEEIQELTDCVIGKYVTFEDLQMLVNDFNYAYALKGYVTARAFLPPQTIEDGIVRINLVEGTVGDITVEGNKWTKDSYIKNRISAKSGELFEISLLEQDILKFNRYNDRIKLKANLAKGKETATTDINLQAKEKNPFHVVALMDNAGRKTIGELRGGLMLAADSLFGQRDRLSIGSYVSRYSVTPFADYNIPVNKYDGRVGFTFSSSFANIGEGPYEIFDIKSRSYTYSLYYTHPLIRKPNFELTSYTAINYKQANTRFGDFSLYTDKIASAETALSARYDSKRGIWYLNQGVYHAFPIFDDNSKYFKYTGSLIRLHDFSHGIVGQFRASYQYSPTDVMPYIDQFQAGGLATIRGYSEGLLIGRSGYILSGELVFPLAPQSITLKNKKNGEKRKVTFLGKYIKGVLFIDHAGIYPFKGEGPGARSYNSDDYIVSCGFGIRIALPADASARLYWGIPLMHNNHEVYRRNPRFSFEISLAPDFDRILELRRNLKEKQKSKEDL